MLAPPTVNNNHSDADSSDSDWDQDDDFASRKINITIKPAVQVTPSKISASVDELRATVGTWKSLANVNLVKPNSRRHHQSTLQLNNAGAGPPNGHPILLPSTSSMILPSNSIVQQVAELSMNRSASVIENNQQSGSALFGNIETEQPSFAQQNVTPVMEPTFHMAPLDLLQPLRSDINQNCPNPSLNLFISDPDKPLLSDPKNLTCNGTTFTKESTRLPIGLAIQECINARSFCDGTMAATLIGRIKMAAPPELVHADPSLKQNLGLIFTSDVAWDEVQVNTGLASENLASTNGLQLRPSKNIKVDMSQIRKHSLEQYERKPDSKYFIMPEIMKYAISLHSSDLTYDWNPIRAISLCQCDMKVTKIRIEVQLNEQACINLGISESDIRNLRISMRVDGPVISQKSKPDADWNVPNSTISWSFGSLYELMEQSSSDGTAYCLARFELAQGMSSQSCAELQFSIFGKTLSGTQVSLDNSVDFSLAKIKCEVRTGSFVCEPPNF